MTSKELIRMNLENSMNMILDYIEQAKELQTTHPTANGGGHPLWVLGHLALTEGDLVRGFMLGEANPLAKWQSLFGHGTEPVDDATAYPPFDEVMAAARAARESTLHLIEGLSEADLDKPSKQCPEGFEQYFRTFRHCLQFTSDHWMMHRGQIADARRSAGAVVPVM